MAQRYLEREVKLAVDDSFRMPDLGALVPAGGILQTALIHLDSTYFDTAGHDLLNAKVTLRRRAGGPSDTGWQLKVPAGVDRTEFRLPPGGSPGVPRELRDLTAGLRRGRSLRQVARIRTERTTYQLCAVDGELLVEVADDQVRATTLGGTAVISTWREIEVELGTGDKKLVAAIVKRLRAVGALPSGVSSKLARAIGTARTGGGAPAAPRPTAGRPTVGALAMAYLVEQHQALLDGDVALRGGFDAIHRTRVASRRMRSTLRTYRALFDAEPAAALDAELRWYAGLLGAVRDPDVLRAHLRDTIAQLPDHLVLGPVASRVEQDLLHEQAQQHRALLKALTSRRYYALLDAVEAWIADPPFTSAAEGPETQAVEWAEHAHRKLSRRLKNAANNPDDPELVHRARKAAKRARYATELATPALKPKAARQTIKRTRAVQDTLGEFQDSVVAYEALLLMGIRAGAAANENGFTYGLLYALEQRRADESRRAVLATRR
ncbi:MAG: CYTH and CHAD domain-containing protein [Actinomycetota bacterium]|nr:CYTH and CHAD domain-containing protein [Actinomycetota bacterium]